MAQKKALLLLKEFRNWFNKHLSVLYPVRAFGVDFTVLSLGFHRLMRLAFRLQGFCRLLGKSDLKTNHSDYDVIITACAKVLNQSGMPTLTLAGERSISRDFS